MTWPAMAVGLAAIITGAVFDMKTMEVPLYVFPPAIVLSILLVYKGLGPVWYAESLISGMTVLVWMGLVCSVTYLVRRRLEGEDAQAPLGGADLMCSALCCFIFGASGIAVTFFAFILCLPIVLKKHRENDRSPYPLIPAYLPPYIILMLLHLLPSGSLTQI